MFLGVASQLTKLVKEHTLVSLVMTVLSISYTTKDPSSLPF